MKKKMRIRAWLLTAILLLACTIPCLGATAQEELIAAQEEQEETVSSLVSLQERIDAIEAKKGESEAYLLELNTQISELNTELEDVQRRFSEKQHELDTTNQELANALLDQQRQRENMAIRIQYMYENSMDAGILEAVFSAQSFSELLNRADNMHDLTEYDRKMLEDYEAVCALVEERKVLVEQEQQEIEVLREEVEAKREEMVILSEQTRSEVQTLARDLQDSEGEAAALIAQIEEQQARIQALSAEVAAQVAAAEAAARAAAQAQAEAEAAAAAQQAGAGATEAAQAGESSGEPAEAAAEGETAAEASAEETPSPADDYSWDGPVLNRVAGVNQGPTGKETYYNLNMSGVVSIMRNMGNNDEYWVRDDGVKMLGDYVMVAANLESHPRGSLVDSSLGKAIVCDTGTFAATNPEQLDIAVAW